MYGDVLFRARTSRHCQRCCAGGRFFFSRQWMDEWRLRSGFESPDLRRHRWDVQVRPCENPRAPEVRKLGRHLCVPRASVVEIRTTEARGTQRIWMWRDFWSGFESLPDRSRGVGCCRAGKGADLDCDAGLLTYPRQETQSSCPLRASTQPSQFHDHENHEPPRLHRHRIEHIRPLDGGRTETRGRTPKNPRR